MQRNIALFSEYEGGFDFLATVEKVGCRLVGLKAKPFCYGELVLEEVR